MRTFALIPAAGKSRRMGRPKLLLPLGESKVLEHVLSAVRSAGVTDTLVVVAPDGEAIAVGVPPSGGPSPAEAGNPTAIADCALAAGAHVLRLESDTPDMRTTCLHGLAWITEHLHPRQDDGWLLIPADHPTLGPEVIRTLLTRAAESNDKSIFIPTHGGRRGHPTWLSWSHVHAIGAMPPDEGLNAYIRSRVALTLEIPWPSDEILLDLDTPEDYARICRS